MPADKAINITIAGNAVEPRFRQGVPDKTISRREFKTCSFNRLARVVSLRFGILVFLTRRLAWTLLKKVLVRPSVLVGKQVAVLFEGFN